MDKKKWARSFEGITERKNFKETTELRIFSQKCCVYNKFVAQLHNVVYIINLLHFTQGCVYNIILLILYYCYLSIRQLTNISTRRFSS